MSLVLVLHLWQWNPWVPFDYASDALYTLSVAKAIAQHHVPWLNPNLGAPYGANWLDFPAFTTIDSLFMLALTAITRYPGLLVNALWLAATVATAASACWSFIRLGLRETPAIALGAVYALQPFTFARGITHLNLVFYAVPLLCAAAIELASGRWIARARMPRYVWIGVVLQGFAYAYGAFFACFALLIATLGAFCARKTRHSALLGVGALAALTAATLINLSPSLVYVASHGANPGLAYKNAAESEVYALKLRQLFTPIPEHPFPPLRAIEKRIAEVHFQLETENVTSRLGTLASLGLLYLFAVALLACFGSRPAPPVTMASAGLAIACVLLATTGGFGALFNVLVFDDIRAYNRIVVFVSFFALVGLGEWLSGVWDRVAGVKVPRAWATAALAALALLAGYDQAAATQFRDHMGRGRRFAEDAAYVKRIEAAIPANAAVFELPFTDFPLDVGHPPMGPYDQARPYIHSHGTRWSWGAMSERKGQWNVETAKLAAPQMLARLKQAGFAGVWLDRAGYDAGQSPEAGLTAALGAPIDSEDGRIAFYALAGYTPPAGAGAEADPMFVFYSTGFYPFETGAGERWRWCGKTGRIDFENPSRASRTVRFSMMLKTGQAEAAPVDVTVDGARERLLVSSAGTAYERTMTIPAAARVRMTLRAHGEPSVTGPGDFRTGLYIQVVDPKLTIAP